MSFYVVILDVDFSSPVPYLLPTPTLVSIKMLAWRVLLESPDHSDWRWTHHVSGFSRYFWSHNFPLVVWVIHRMFDGFTSELFVIKKTRRPEVMFRGRMKAASTIFQSSAMDNVSIAICGFLQFRILLPSTQNSYRVERDCFPVSEWPRFIPAHDVDFNQPLTFILPIPLLLRITSNLFSLGLSRRNRNCLFKDWIQRKIGEGPPLLFRAEESIEDDIFFCRKFQFVLESPLHPSQRWINCRFVPQCVNPERCPLVRWLRHVVLYYICVVVRGAKSELSSITKLAVRVREERRATEIELNSMKV